MTTHEVNWAMQGLGNQDGLEEGSMPCRARLTYNLHQWSCYYFTSLAIF